jgi:hypothetical protein
MAARLVLDAAVREGSTLIGMTKVNDSDLKKGFVGITEATKLLGIAHAQYVRRLVVGGRLDSLKVQLDSTAKWFISRESIADYMKVNRRTSTDRRYILRTAIENEDAIRKALDGAGVTYQLELNYKK